MPTEKKKASWAVHTVNAGLWLPPELKEAAKRLAKAEGRKFSDWLRRLIEREVKAAEEREAENHV